MQAVRIYEYGDPSVMKLEDAPTLVPGAGEVLVRVEAASVNFLDIVQRRGDTAKQNFYNQNGLGGEFPITLGSQGVGIVEQLGEGVSNVKVGERVAFGGQGTYATHFIANAARVIPVPAALTLEQAAGGLIQGFVAYQLTNLAYPIKPGEWALIHAAAGGVGLLAVQMAKLRGGKVIGVTSSEDKAQAVRAAGADEIIISTRSDIAKEARRITGGKGVSVVYDGVGKDTFEASLDSLAPRGYLVIFGQSSGYIPPFDLMLLQEKGSLFITRTNAGFYFEDFPAYLRDLVTWVQAGKLQIKADRTFPLAQVAQAHALVEGRQSTGRVLLIP
ncbi:MAG TPA: quinone oxidoreductase [Phototrophicaceae bacterium]|nr:quinone oxidoreductase [Phototrophicaceae bacterium]